MKLNENFVLRQVADTWVVLPLGEATVNFHGMLTLNETGALLWQALEQGASREDLADALTKEYVVSREIALADVDAFLVKLDKTGCLEK